MVPSPPKPQSLHQPRLEVPCFMEGTISQPRHRARGHRRTETDAEAKPWPLGTRWQQPWGTPTGVTWQPRASTGGQGTGMVTLQCPQAGRGRLIPPPALLAPGSWERPHATGTQRGPSSARPLPQPPPPRGRGQASPEHGESAGATGATVSPRETSTYPMQECLRDGHRLPGSIVPLRQPRWLWRGRPRQWQCQPAPRHAIPQPLVFLPWLPIPDGTGDTKPHCPSDGPAG